MTVNYRNIALWLLLATNVCVACGTVVSAYGGAVNPEVTAIPAILAMTFPGWLIAVIVVLAVDLFFCRRAAFIAVGTLVACVGPIMTYAPLNFGSGGSGKYAADSTFTLVTYNTYEMKDIYDTDTVPHTEDYYRRAMADGRVNQQLDYINTARAQVLCLQETAGIGNFRNYTTTEQADSFRALYPHCAAYNGVSVRTAYPSTPVRLRQFEESTSAAFAAAEVDIEGHKTLVVSVHLQSIGLDDSDKALYYDITEGEGRHHIGAVRHRLLSKLSRAFKFRARQARLLREQIDSLGYENVIIAGDFNDIPGCYAMRVLMADDFSSAFRQAGRGPQITYHVNRFYFNIDHVLYRGQMRAIGYHRGACRNSDHYPVVVTFAWDD